MRADARRNRERLVHTAREAFAEQGTDVALDDIARRAGVGPGTLYRHFPTREALVEAVYRGDITALSDRAYELIESLPPADALVRWLREEIRFVIEKRGLHAALHTLLEGNAETFAWCRGTLHEAGEALIANARRAGAIRPDVTATDLLRLGHGLGIASQNTPDIADHLVSVLLDGLRPRREPDAPRAPG